MYDSEAKGLDNKNSQEIERASQRNAGMLDARNRDELAQREENGLTNTLGNNNEGELKYSR